jgi:hypothetical protein
MSNSKWKRLGGGIWAVVMAAILVQSSLSAANNFNAAADRKGCESLLTEDKQRECREGPQKAKNDACNVKSSCSPRDQEDLIAKYKEVQKRLSEGTLNDSDKDAFERRLRDIKSELDQNKAAAVRGQEIANNCIKARDAVQYWFENTAIRFTEERRDAALNERKDLLAKLNDAQKKVEDAKRNREAKPGDSSAQSDYDRAIDEMRAVENALAAFNVKYGPDIDYNAGRLIQHYKDQKSKHIDGSGSPSFQAEERLENCKKVEALSY